MKVRCPADTMFGNEIRMGGLQALTKFKFVEAIEAATTQPELRSIPPNKTLPHTP